MGDRQLVRHVKAIAYRLDPVSVLNRARQAEADRRVSLRPAPDTMAYLIALLPAAQAVAAYAALTGAADTARSAADERGKGAVMADTLVERVTGQTNADEVEVEVQVVISDQALFGDGDGDQGDETPAQLAGYGTVPAGWVRDLITPRTTSDSDIDGGAAAESSGACDTRPAMASGSSDAKLRDDARVWLRRLYAHPTSGQLTGMDSTRRVFEGALRTFLMTRDAGICRTPWCDAPIRHLDHIHDHADGGPTAAGNGQGLCVRCNHTKQLPGFTARTLEPSDALATAPSHHLRFDRAYPDHRQHRHTVELTTPTGHHYHSTAPPLLPGRQPDPRTATRRAWPEQPPSQLELEIERRIRAA